MLHSDEDASTWQYHQNVLSKKANASWHLEYPYLETQLDFHLLQNKLHYGCHTAESKKTFCILFSSMSVILKKVETEVVKWTGRCPDGTIQRRILSFPLHSTFLYFICIILQSYLLCFLANCWNTVHSKALVCYLTGKLLTCSPQQGSCLLPNRQTADTQSTARLLSAA